MASNSIYNNTHVLDNKYLECLRLYNLKINENIEVMFPDAEAFIDQRLKKLNVEKEKTKSK